MKFISPEDVRVGDTIAWASSSSKYVINYMLVEDIEECESNFSGYINGVAQFNSEDYPCLGLRGKVMCEGGERIDAYTNGVYPYNLHKSLPKILLINRMDRS
jgi:hypothetical protein